ncbi:MAG TPA: hypothetical protein VGW74_06365 [Propionibacteriaceae bacterium]|nr:hypothetical protein [Propionibacteriaceae bacterium]
MFFCSPCAKARDWPESIFKSVGPCEVCGKTRACSEVHSGALPPPQVRPARHDARQTLRSEED